MEIPDETGGRLLSRRPVSVPFIDGPAMRERISHNWHFFPPFRRFQTHKGESRTDIEKIKNKKKNKKKSLTLPRSFPVAFASARSNCQESFPKAGEHARAGDPNHENSDVTKHEETRRETCRVQKSWPH